MMLAGVDEMPYCVGVTGSIGSGKSTVAKLLADQPGHMHHIVFQQGCIEWRDT